ncbi:hypothetical protein Tco_0861924, partial [Tanacetum coccineum]
GKPQHDDTGLVKSGYSRHMTGNIAYLSYFKEFDEGYVTFGEEHMVVEFLLPDESQILLKIPRKDNMYSFDMKHIVSKESLTCLVAKATSDESMLWHRRLIKAFRVYNTRTRRVEENLHIGFLENKTMIEGNGPKLLFDIDSLTQSMNYVPITAGTISNESIGTQGEFSAGTSQEINQYCIVMPIWKDALYFDSPTQDDGDGPDNENKEQEVNAVRQHVNTASLDVNTGSSKLNTVDPSVNTASSYDQDSPKDLFTIGASHTLKATHVEFFSDEDEPKVDLGNITNSYTIKPTSIAKALSDSSWVETMQEELL